SEPGEGSDAAGSTVLGIITAFAFIIDLYPGAWGQNCFHSASSDASLLAALRVAGALSAAASVADGSEALADLVQGRFDFLRSVGFGAADSRLDSAGAADAGLRAAAGARAISPTSYWAI